MSGWGRSTWGSGPWGQPAVVNVSVNLTGVAITSAIGSLTVVAGGIVTLNGQAIT